MILRNQVNLDDLIREYFDQVKQGILTLKIAVNGNEFLFEITGEASYLAIFLRSDDLEYHKPLVYTTKKNMIDDNYEYYTPRPEIIKKLQSIVDLIQS